MNDDVNPWLIAHGVPGSANAEIATLEHIGRTSGLARFTPVHPTIRGETALIPVPLGAGSQWARNVVAAGRARLQLHEVLYDLDGPALIPVAETGLSRRRSPAPSTGWAGGTCGCTSHGRCPARSPSIQRGPHRHAAPRGRAAGHAVHDPGRRRGSRRDGERLTAQVCATRPAIPSAVGALLGYGEPRSADGWYKGVCVPLPALTL